VTQPIDHPDDRVDGTVVPKSLAQARRGPGPHP
jgi:hypothetical protein